MKKEELERLSRQEEYNGEYSVLKHYYKKMTRSKSIDDINYYNNGIDGFIRGLYTVHFIHEAEFKQLKKELDDIYDIRIKEAFDTEKGRTI